ncbi:response regulator transcription factor [Diaminobutyricibacter tongyongensis]|uniref:Response regulator transcription factor n=1 Tax=Leifsonia tongyongensis TaxID=1268043 RepID=A0A6L9XVU8_9MICO|nr:LuxR C-terminal-related transcriptional regulator [Diaminobutyricibacter tongyongensis]NEN05154.1 response regulator transcription factor [Diaminobutyricibacter tongyongensis]
MPDSGRIAFAEKRWEDAFALFSEEDRAQPLGLDDLELYAKSAALTAREEVGLALLERGYTACLAAGDELRAATAAFWLGFRLSSLGEMGRAQAWLARSAAIAERHGDCAVRGYLLVPGIHRLLLARENEAAYRDALEAAAVGDRFAEPDLAALGRQLAGRALIERGDVAEGMGLLDEAMLIATADGLTDLGRGLVYCAVVGCCQRVFALDRAREWSTVLDDWCSSQTQLGLFNGTCRVHRAEILQLGGAWSDALAETRRVTDGKPDQRELALADYEAAELHRLRGEADEAERLYEAASRRGLDPQPGLSLLRLAQGDLASAVGGIRRATATTVSPLGRARYLPALVEILLAADPGRSEPDRAGRSELAEAQDAAAELGEIATTFGTPLLRALALNASALVRLRQGDAAAAAPLLAEALDAWLALAAPYPAARIRIAFADACDRLGDTEGARMQRDAARRVFRELDAAPDLAALGDERMHAAGGILSARELEVLRAAATGRTNKEIGANLGLSSRTVDRHVSNILTKLGVPSRAAATSYAYEHGLIRR